MRRVADRRRTDTVCHVITRLQVLQHPVLWKPPPPPCAGPPAEAPPGRGPSRRPARRAMLAVSPSMACLRALAQGHWPKAIGPRPLAHIQTRKAPRGRSSPAPLRASLTRRACTAPSAAVMTAAAARCAYSRCGGRSLKGTEGTAL